MKFGTGSNAERTQKYGGSKYKMTYIRPNIYINKQTSPIFDCVTPVSVSLATLARQLMKTVTIQSSLIKSLYGTCCSSYWCYCLPFGKFVGVQTWH